MKADITRNSFNSYKHFARVLMQQGRVQLDADWNEQAAIFLHYLQTLAADLIGPAAGPLDHCAFVVTPLQTAKPVLSDFLITPGRYYVDGILCELDPEPVPVTAGAKPNTLVVASWTVDGREFATSQLVELIQSGQASKFALVTGISQADKTITLDGLGGLAPTSIRRVTTFRTQPDLPDPGPLPAADYLIYLDVWERLITFAEDDAVREVALNGADTAARSKIVWQVKAAVDGAGDPTAVPPNRGFLRARSIKSAASTDPCIISPNARYSGPENQLYRIEIHSGSQAPGGPTFKWSRENGAVLFPIVRVTGSSAVLENLGRDDRFGLAEGDFVEIQDDDSVLLNRAEKLLQLQFVDSAGMTVTFTDAPGSTSGTSPAKHPLLRRWDQQQGDTDEGGVDLAADNAAKVVESSHAWIDLENGVQIQFQPAVAGEVPPVYLTGDYWLIPARTATGDVEWPAEAAVDEQGAPIQSPIALPPVGIKHHYAPLANLTVSGDGSLNPPTLLTKTFSPVP
jgi:hypothetical protein